MTQSHQNFTYQELLTTIKVLDSLTCRYFMKRVQGLQLLKHLMNEAIIIGEKEQIPDEEIRMLASKMDCVADEIIIRGRGAPNDAKLAQDLDTLLGSTLDKVNQRLEQYNLEDGQPHQAFRVVMATLKNFDPKV